jgi:hypothetical protein
MLNDNRNNQSGVRIILLKTDGDNHVCSVQGGNAAISSMASALIAKYVSENMPGFLLMKSGPLNIFLNQARREKRYLDKIGGFK